MKRCIPTLALLTLAALGFTSSGCESEAAFVPSDLPTDSTTPAASDAAGPELWLDAPEETVALGTPFAVRLETVDTPDDIVEVAFDPEGIVEVDSFAASSGETLALIAIGEGTTTLTVTNSDGLTAATTLRAAPIAEMSVVSTTNAFSASSPVLTEVAPAGLVLPLGTSVTYGARAFDDEGRDMLVDYRTLWEVVIGDERVELTFPEQANWVTVEAVAGEGPVILDCAGTGVELAVAPDPEPAALQVWAWDFSLSFDPEDVVLSGAPPYDVLDTGTSLGVTALDADGRVIVDPDRPFSWLSADETVVQLLVGSFANQAVAVAVADGTTEITVTTGDLQHVIQVEAHDPPGSP